MRQIKILAKLELLNLFGFNVLRHMKDKQEQKKKLALAVTLVIVVLMFAFYAGALSFGLVTLGLQNIVPVYLTAICSILTLFFGIFKAGQTIFRRNGYDIIFSLPLSRTAVVTSRFLRMYVENLFLICVIMLPGSAVYGAMVKPDLPFYLFGFVGFLLIPLIPMSAAVLVGTLITGIASRMRRKGIVEAVLSVGLVVVFLTASANLGSMAHEMTPEMLRELSDNFLSWVGRIYAPALWLGFAMTEGLYFKGLLFAVVSLAFCALAVVIVSGVFQAVYRRLAVDSAKHDYRMREQSQESLMTSLCRRELRRYFASGIYVMNTIMGPVLGAVASVALFVAGAGKVADAIPFGLDMGIVAPLAIATIFCMMNLTCVSVSMEGKNWWITKSLPLDTRSVLDAKVLAGLIVMLPFWFVAEVFLLLALRPGFWNALWIVFMPLAILFFSSVFGVTVNLHLPLMKWDNEVSVVKQSASALVGGLGGVLAPLLCTLAAVVLPRQYLAVFKPGIFVLFLALSILLRSRNHRTDLRKI